MVPLLLKESRALERASPKAWWNNCSNLFTCSSLMKLICLQGMPGCNSRIVVFKTVVLHCSTVGLGNGPVRRTVLEQSSHTEKHNGFTLSGSVPASLINRFKAICICLVLISLRNFWEKCQCFIYLFIYFLPNQITACISRFTTYTTSKMFQHRMRIFPLAVIR